MCVELFVPFIRVFFTFSAIGFIHWWRFWTLVVGWYWFFLWFCSFLYGADIDGWWSFSHKPLSVWAFVCATVLRWFWFGSSGFCSTFCICRSTHIAITAIPANSINGSLECMLLFYGDDFVSILNTTMPNFHLFTPLIAWKCVRTIAIIVFPGEKSKKSMMFSILGLISVKFIWTYEKKWAIEKLPRYWICTILAEHCSIVFKNSRFDSLIVFPSEFSAIRIYYSTNCICWITQFYTYIILFVTQHLCSNSAVWVAAGRKNAFCIHFLVSHRISNDIHTRKPSKLGMRVRFDRQKVFPNSDSDFSGAHASRCRPMTPTVTSL